MLGQCYEKENFCDIQAMALLQYKYVTIWVVTGKQKTREYSRIAVTGTLGGNEKQFVLAGNLSYRGKFL